MLVILLKRFTQTRLIIMQTSNTSRDCLFLGPRNRKYYRITPEGRQRQAELLKEWEEYKFIIDDIVKGGNSND